MLGTIKYWLILFVAGHSIGSYAHNIYLLQRQKPIQEIKLSHHCDSTETKTIKDIQLLNFEKFTVSAVNLTYTKLPHWFAFSYYNENTEENYYLHFENPLIDSIEVFFVQDNHVIEKHVFGDHYTFKTRNYNLPDFLVKLPPNANKVVDVYLKIKCEISLLAPVKLYSESALIKTFTELSWGTGLYYGALLFIFLFNLFLYTRLKDKSYLFYITFLFCYGMSLFNFDGYMFKYMFPNFPQLNNLALYFWIYASTIFGTWFAISFLELKRTWSFGYKLILISNIPVYVFIILLFIYPDIIFHDIVCSIFAALVSLIGIIVGVTSWIRGNKSAKFYSIAYTFVLTSVIIYVLKDLGMLPSNSFTEYIMHFGSGIEMILLSLGLADKYNRFKAASELAQQKIIENLEEIQKLQNITNQELEEKVRVRTQQINEQKLTLEEKQKEILDSITYAKRLQEAILPPKKFIDKHLPQNFILYKPKDIVAGDFYWSYSFVLDNTTHYYIAAADSTGHGVPGALVSIVCSNALFRSVKEFELQMPGEILNKTRELVIETFEKSDADVKDGMDISLIHIKKTIYPETGEIHTEINWSGANNPLWYIYNNELIKIKPDKQAIGKVDYPKPFTTHRVKYEFGTCFYLFTDGFADQFGGPDGKKYKYKQLEQILLSSYTESIGTQRTIIEQSFDNWKGKLEQVDDVCVIGFKL
ncbi:MAG: SpoIIE family protein phosphatase [Bacteroidia bacterium]|nr:SpoIIE family protein phosphatase [Bacteroidia bacterium]